MGQDLSASSSIISEQFPESVSNSAQCLPDEGFLKVSPYPFPSSMRLASSSTCIYAQKAKTLQQQIVHRRKTSNSFTQSQIFDLIQSSVYALVTLQHQNITYKDISAQHIFVVQHQSLKQSPEQFSLNFKLLPNNLLQESTYQRLLRINKRVVQQQKCFTFSPEIIIALRARQKQFSDPTLLKKSSIFSLGIVFLETAVLKLSYEFYDTITFDIYEEFIQQCLIEVEKKYGEVVARIIANMIDFDFEQRIQGFNQLAKWLIYEIQTYQEPNHLNTKQIQAGSNEEISFSKTKSIPINISERSPTHQVSLGTLNHQESIQSLNHQQSIQTLPVCLQSNQSKIKHRHLISTESMPQLDQISERQKQNIQTQNKINIKTRQVSVYLEKNSKLQSDQQNKPRLFYSPFLSTSSQDREEYEFRANTKMNLVKQFSKRSLAFDEPMSKTKRNYFLESLTPMTNHLKNQRY